MSVAYNFLNLPKQMLWSDGTGAEKIIDILYDAKGRKLRKTVTNNGALLYRQDYNGSLEYRFTTANGLQPEAAYFGDGRVTFIENYRRYEYYLKDHLGNIRLTFTDKNNNGVVDVNNTANNEILQVERKRNPVGNCHYYPFGMDLSGPWMNDAALDNGYKYNGKELNTDFGLQWMDYGARWYDGALGRWWSIDPMVGALGAFSPYAYGALNPISNIDFFGMYPMAGSNNSNGTGMSTSANPGFEEMKEESRKKVERNLVKKDEPKDIIVGGIKWTKGATGEGESEFVQQTFAALNKISEHYESSQVLDFFLNSDRYNILINQGYNTEAYPTVSPQANGQIIVGKVHDISFKSTLGILNSTSGQSFSPAIALFHEIGHVKNAVDNPSDFINRRRTKVENWGNAEERFTIEKWEIPLARYFCELERTCYGCGELRTITTNNSTSNSIKE